MIRVIALAAALSLATTASAATSKSKSSPAQKGTMTEAKRALMNAKRALKTAVDLCSNPGKCEHGSRNADREYISMLESADRNFIEACLACSTPERCDSERDRIKDGKRSQGTVPCD
jgi:hypothetical protein